MARSIQSLKSIAVEKGYAQYTVIDNKGNTEFKWADEIQK